ncbi:MAG TPA: CatB-related O-acetyltransferase [Planctomycetota bacterium]|nr:CatB-related O-acetyltransferase [Planctomycetota bacterium]
MASNDRVNDPDLRASIAAPGIRLVYRMLGGRRRWTVARLICRVLLKLEGGPFRSATVRRILAEDYGVTVGAHTYGDCLVPGAFPPGVVIGRYSSVSEGARVYNQNHPIERLSTHPYFYDEALRVAAGEPLPRHDLVIGHDVWVGRNAIVTPGCKRIGNGAVIGAGAVVTKDVEDFSIVVGVPARHLRYRFDERTRRAISESAWWHRTIDDIRRDPKIFAVNAAELDDRAWRSLGP